MSKLNYFAEKISKFKNRRTKNSNPPPTNELAHPRFGITEEDKSAAKKAPNSLLFLMYSKENETLFI
ncbi:hypothetical protein BSF41_06440 [Flavobacterium sp. ACN2]|jgi:hypothetical protein|uniref:hypothetical protein n=1 Tax=unclassified Flavobacterium TaxID=196869 RepID=UPI000BB2E072|nr:MULTISPECIES: hypothetical protein [unclassified Flavobacterium]MDY0987869.1 hypothetical protein [Flavobacterium sp. CFBP9031]PBI93562.1 hypothetical protein BSF41_06440 [Flavobacterium sp. ACN2]